VTDGLPDGVQPGQRTVNLHQAAHSKGTEINGREPEVVDDRAEPFFGVLVVAGVEQDPTTGVGDGIGGNFGAVQVVERLDDVRPGN